MGYNIDKSVKRAVWTEVWDMGRYLNRGNQKFAKFSASKYFVDKTRIINKLLEKNDDQKFICNSRPRRFGKSITAHMLVAYFSKGADSRALFAPLKCEKDEVFIENFGKVQSAREGAACCEQF